tara:strand:- start:1562 stop:1822 length:261 start_codon:yes stop_codon:yes gene_type:complete
MVKRQVKRWDFEVAGGVAYPIYYSPKDSAKPVSNGNPQFRVTKVSKTEDTGELFHGIYTSMIEAFKIMSQLEKEGYVTCIERLKDE